MRYHYLSDLHIDATKNPKRIGEFIPETMDSDTWIPEINRLIVAGDISQRSSQLKLFLSECSYHFADVIVVLGNHDYIEEGIGADVLLRRFMEDKVTGFPNIHVLTDTNECVEFGDIIFFGGTMWTNYNKRNTVDMEAAKRYMPELRYLSQIDICEEHDRFLYRLEKFNSDAYGEKVRVCLTHHMPDSSSISPRYFGSAINSAFAAGVKPSLINKFDVWIHGHTHSEFNHQTQGAVTILCNPHGYPRENPKFTPCWFSVENQAYVEVPDSHLVGPFPLLSDAFRYSQNLHSMTGKSSEVVYKKGIVTQKGTPIKCN